ncbi:MAG: hypothetical protein IKD40_01595 [Bacteroidaceae bacterium]|nr:hypothetical protein [Bacteroidaceae bacterium]
MKSKTLLTTQLTSLIVLILTGSKLLEDYHSTILFAVSFISFAYCCIYINRHEKELLKELESNSTENDNEL